MRFIYYAKQKVEYCPLDKNKWIALPQTNYSHNNTPKMQKRDNYILYIASVTAECIEFIDLRDTKCWMKMDKSWTDLLGIEIKTTEAFNIWYMHYVYHLFQY